MKQLLKQIWNERRVNSWLWAELLIVFVVLWYVVDWGYTNAVTYYEPLGFDITDTYLVSVTGKTDKAVDYIDPSAASQTGGQDMLDLVNRLRQLPEVEAVAISNNATPYCGTNRGIRLRKDSVGVWLLRRPVTPDFFRVFRYKSADGQGYQPLIDALERDEVVVNKNLFKNAPDMTLQNKILYNLDDSTGSYRVGGISNKVRYNEFWSNYRDNYISWMLSEGSIAGQSDASWCEVSLRVHPGTSDDFSQRLLEMSDTRFAIGNLFISKVESFEDIRRHNLAPMFNTVKTRVWMMAFLLMNIFLGIIGAFWFRTQQRRAEIGLRIALGSSRVALWKRLMNEGLVLLVLASIPAMAICINLGWLDIVSTYPFAFSAIRFVVCALITLLLMTVMIVLGIWYPAKQAMSIEPAEALHEE